MNKSLSQNHEDVELIFMTQLQETGIDHVPYWLYINLTFMKSFYIYIYERKRGKKGFVWQRFEGISDKMFEVYTVSVIYGH